MFVDSSLLLWVSKLCVLKIMYHQNGIYSKSGVHHIGYLVMQKYVDGRMDILHCCAQRLLPYPELCSHITAHYLTLFFLCTSKSLTLFTRLVELIDFRVHLHCTPHTLCNLYRPGKKSINYMFFVSVS